MLGKDYVYNQDSPYVTDNVGTFADELNVLLTISRQKRFDPGETVYTQGETSDNFYFIRDGRVKLSLLKEDGSEKILAILGKNTFLGEGAAFDRYPYFSSAIALETTEISVFDAGKAEALLMDNPRISLMIIASIVRKVRLLSLHIEDVTFLDAQKRIAHMLLKLSGEIGEVTKKGLLITKNIAHEDIAHLTGLSRVTVTNILNYFEKLKIIKKGRLRLTITSRKGLSTLLKP